MTARTTIRNWLLFPGLIATIGLACTAPGRAVTFDCVMEPAQKVKVGSSVTGVLKSVLVSRGDTVRAGQEIAKLDSSVEAASVALSKLQASSVESIEAQKSRLKLVRQKLGRSEPLAAKGITTQEKLDELRAEADIAERDLNTEQMKQRLAQIEQQRAEAILDLRTIRSPLTGLVMDRNLSAGEFVNQEAFIMTLVQLDPLFVEAYVPVAYWGKIKKDLIGTVRPAEPVGGSYQAPVTVVDHVFDAASGTFGVRLELKNAANALPGGQRCKVDFDVEPAMARRTLDGAGARPRQAEDAAINPARDLNRGRP
jgi:RND family efflux transporter MFP subunit